VVDDEGFRGNVDGGSAKAEGVDAPMGERLGVVGGDKALTAGMAGIVDPVDHEVVAAGVVQDGAANRTGQNPAKSAMEAPYRLRCGFCPGPYKT
jgi:hypothetical protein